MSDTTDWQAFAVELAGNAKRNLDAKDDEIDRLKAQLKETEEKGRVIMDISRDLKARVGELETMVKVFRGCIETGLMPEPGSPCQMKVFELVGESEGAVKAGGEK